MRKVRTAQLHCTALRCAVAAVLIALCAWRLSLLSLQATVRHDRNLGFKSDGTKFLRRLTGPRSVWRQPRRVGQARGPLYVTCLSNAVQSSFTVHVDSCCPVIS
jgi:hypothetical protein